jgi:fatty-acyl-CoA synthase
MQNQGIGSWPRRRARSSPHRVAVVHNNLSLTYDLMDERVTRLAQALRTLGVRYGDRVAYLGPNHPAFLEALFATGALGAVFVPLNTRLAGPEIDHMLLDSAARVLIFDAECASTVDTIAGRPGVTTLPVDVAYEALLAAASADPIDEPVRHGDIAMIMYTSGTTGTPKGATLSHGNLVWNCLNVLVDIDVAADEVTLVTAPMFHTASLNMTCLPTLLKGGRVILESAFDAERVIDLVEQRRVTMMFGVPTMYETIASSPRWATADLTSLRTLICGGAPVPEALIERYLGRGLSFVQGYGMTETAPGALLVDRSMAHHKVGSAGVPHFFTDVRVVRPDLSDVGVNEPGEVLVSGPNVMPGYWNRPAETGGAFAEDGSFRSGDIAILDKDGYAYIVDRAKDVIISGGENIYPAEVENVLYRHPDVAECAVIGVPDETWGEVGRAVVVLRPGADGPAEALLTFLGGQVARYKVPKSVVVVPELPHTANGKLRRPELRRLYGAPTTVSSPQNGQGERA